MHLLSMPKGKEKKKFDFRIVFNVRRRDKMSRFQTECFIIKKNVSLQLLIFV